MKSRRECEQVSRRDDQRQNSAKQHVRRCEIIEPRRRRESIGLGLGRRRQRWAAVAERAALVVAVAVESGAGGTRQALARLQISVLTRCASIVRPACASRLTSVEDGTCRSFVAACVGHSAGVAEGTELCLCHERRQHAQAQDHTNETNTLRNCSDAEKAQHHAPFAFCTTSLDFFRKKKNE